MAPHKSKISDKLKDDPISRIRPEALKGFIKNLHSTQFQDTSMTFEELWIAGQLAKKFNNHPIEEEVEERAASAGPDDESHLAAGDTESTPGDGISVGDPPRPSFDPSVSERRLLGRREWDQVRKAIKIQQDMRYWLEPKDLIVTLTACCVASLTQGWDQVANGNLGWPKDLGVHINSEGTGQDIWKFGGANAITWFSAAFFGFLLQLLVKSLE